MTTEAQTIARGDLCAECQRPADVRCPPCGNEYCRPCADSIHSLRSFQAHKPSFVLISARQQSAQAASTEHKAASPSAPSPSGPPLPSTIEAPEEEPFEAPTWVAVSKDMIFVTDNTNDAVFLFRSDGSFVRSTRPSDPNSKRQLSTPQGAAYHDGALYVADEGFKRICVFGADGTFLRSWPVPFKPNGLAVGEGLLFITDCWGHRIHSYRLDGTLERSFGSKAEAEGSVQSPQGVAVHAGLVFVASGAHCVSVFRTDGSFVRRWGSQGAGPGQLNNPLGVSVYADQVFVADSENQRINVYSVEGAHLRSIKPKGPEQLHCPSGIAATDRGLIVVDGGAGVVRCFKLDA